MPKRPIRAHWDKVIADLEARLAKAEAVRDALDDPELAEEIIKSLGVQLGPRAVRKRGKPRRLTQVETVVRFFQDRDNNWADSFAISDGTGLKREAVRQVLYKSGSDQVVKRAGPKGPKGTRRVQFRLKSPK